MDNAALLTAARAIVTERRGPMPEPIRINTDFQVYYSRADADRMIASFERADQIKAWNRDVSRVFDELKAGTVLAPVHQISERSIAA